MKKEITYFTVTEIENELPVIKIFIRYRDDFSNEEYLVKNTPVNDLEESFIFDVIKNDKLIGKLNLPKDEKGYYSYENTLESFLNQFLDLTEDRDFNTEFKKSVFTPLLKEMSEFFELYKNSIVMNGLTLEGEKRKMKVMAGIIKNIL